MTGSGATGLAVSGSGRSRTIEITGGQENDVQVRAGLNTPSPATLADGSVREWTAVWRWPDGNSVIADGSSGSVRQGQTLTVTPVEQLTPSGGGDPDNITHPEVVFRFVSAGTAPTVNASVGSESFTNVVHISGTREELETVDLSAVDGGGGGSFEWRIENQDSRTSGTSYTPSLGELTGEQTIVLTQTVDDDDQRTARIKLTIMEQGALILGTQDGVFAASDDSSPLNLAGVENTFNLTTFHTEGQLETSMAQAQITGAAPFVDVPGDGLARVTIAPPAPSPPPEPPRDRVIEILMEYDEPKRDSQGNPVIGWGTRKPAGLEGSTAFSQQQLLSWAARYPGADFLVVGRCGDLGSSSYNQALAGRRAEHVYGLLTSWSGGGDVSAVDPAHVYWRGEQSEWDSSTPDTLEDDPSLPLTADELSDVLPPPENGWLIRQRSDYDSSDHTNWPPNTPPATPAKTSVAATAASMSSPWAVRLLIPPSARMIRKPWAPICAAPTFRLRAAPRLPPRSARPGSITGSSCALCGTAPPSQNGPMPCPPWPRPKWPGRLPKCRCRRSMASRWNSAAKHSPCMPNGYTMCAPAIPS